MEELSILELASKGGWIMIVLAVLSVIALPQHKHRCRPHD